MLGGQLGDDVSIESVGDASEGATRDFRVPTRYFLQLRFVSRAFRCHWLEDFRSVD